MEKFRYKKTSWVVVAHVFHPRTQEADAEESHTKTKSKQNKNQKPPPPPNNWLEGKIIVNRKKGMS